MHKRGFELVDGQTNTDLLPKRETKRAAGYDLKIVKSVFIPAGGTVVIGTGVKAFMQEDEVLMIFDRSSNYRKTGLVLINSVGVIDADYYDTGNEIMLQMHNASNEGIRLEEGYRLAQAVFMNFLKTSDDDETSAKERTGGMGSTDE